MDSKIRSGLPRRLRELRTRRWPDVDLTQPKLARALGVRKKLSVSSISSWESENIDKLPTRDRLADYARFFCTRRSVIGGTCRLIPEDELTREERISRDTLLADLTRLLDGAQQIWRFADGKPIRIVCAPLPPKFVGENPYTRPDYPDYMELYGYADIDSLWDLYGHIRELNPGTRVQRRLISDLNDDDLACHLVLLGGVDLNSITSRVLDECAQIWGLPISQLTRETESDSSWFEVRGDPIRQFAPEIKYLARGGNGRGRQELVSDVAHFLRAPSPFHPRRTVTICNGIYGRGSLGAVRAFTDPDVGTSNARYLEDRFGGSSIMSMLSRVKIHEGKVVSPDWTQPEFRLHEWPDAIQ